jgi:membrane protease YdiL (CAAX protease family)
MEEPGWRGFLLEKLQKIYTAEKSSWILGLIWAVWHYPYLLFLYSNLDLISIIFSIVGFTMAIIGQTFIITWFYNNTKSVLITILLHAWLNTSTTYILGNLTITNPIMGVIPALVTWGIVFILLKKYGGKTLTT